MNTTVLRSTFWVLLVAFIAWDYVHSQPVDLRYEAPLIAAGSGQSVQKINTLIKRYDETRKMMKQMMNPKQAAKMSRMFGGFKGFQ